MTSPGSTGPENGSPWDFGDAYRRTPEGEVEVYGSDEQSDHEVDLDRWLQLGRGALAMEGVQGDAELALIFVDEASMTELNGQFMGKDGPTDVLAFPIDESGPGGRWPDSGPTGPDRPESLYEDTPLLLGDVVVCPAVAVRQAGEHDRSVDDEMALLVVHGILHILGHDHAEPEETARMKARERAILDEFHHRDPSPGGASPHSS